MLHLDLKRGQGEYSYAHWRKQGEWLVPVFSYPPAIRSALYTTHAIAAFTMGLQKVWKYQRVWPHDASVLQAFYWAGERIARPWPVLAWGKARRYCMRSVADRTDL